MPSLNDPKKGTAPAPAPVLTPAATAAGISSELEDRSKYIRTMAKDMASLSSAPAVPAPVKQEPTREETVAGVTLAQEEKPFFEKPQSRVEREADIPVALPSMKEAAAIIAPEPSPETRAAERAAERAAVLDRLRQKVAEAPPAIVVPAPMPPAPPIKTELPDTPPLSVSAPATPAAPIADTKSVSAWSNIPEPTPQFASLAEPTPARIPPVGKESYREPIEMTPPPRPIASVAPEPLHTYTSDFSDRIDSKSASTFSVLAAEQDAQAKPTSALAEPKKSPTKAILAVVTGVLLLALAGGGIVATYQFVMTMRDTPIASLTVPSIVFADEYRELSGTGYELLSALAATGNGPLVAGNVLVTYILTNTDGEDGAILSTPAGGAAFVRALQIPAPDILLRNIAEESTVGIVNAGADTKAFFALRVDSYERTYAGMLTWEPLMMRDLGVLYPLYPAMSASVEEVVATSTATSTMATTTPPETLTAEAAARTRFEDAIVANHDVRILRDTKGRSLILYGYADKRTLLIVRDEAAFEAVLGHLKSQ